MSTKIENFNRATLREISAEANAALQAVAAKFGLTFEAKSGSYSTMEFNFKAQFKLNTPQAAVKQINELASTARMLGLPEDIVGQSFFSNGVEYKITGLDLNRRKYPVSGVNKAGSKYKFTASVVKQSLNLK